MNKENRENLALLLLQASCWDENPKRKYGDKPILRAWKNIPFEILDSLSEKGFISDSRKSKSVFLTEEGIRKAEELKIKFFGQKDLK